MKKNILYNAMVALAAIATLTVSCKKDDIEITKADNSWEVDKGIVDKDIRTHLGYDPRLNYILFDNTVIEMPMLSLGTAADSRTHTKEVKVHLLDKPYTKDVQVTFKLDPTLFEKLKSSYSGYQLKNEDLSLIKIDGSTATTFTKTIAAGQTEVSFTLTTVNDITFNRRVLFPFSFKINEDEKGLIIPQGKNIMVVKVFPETIKIEAEYASVNRLIGLQENLTPQIDGPQTDNYGYVTFKLKSNYQLPEGIKFKLVYDNDAVVAAPAEKADASALNYAVDMDFDALKKDYNFWIKPTFASEAKNYVLPLKWVLTDAFGNEQPATNNKLTVNFTVKGLTQATDNVETAQKAEGEGTRMKRGQIYPTYTNRRLVYNYARNAWNLFDGNPSTYTSFKERVEIGFVFPSVTVIKSIEIAAPKIDDEFKGNIKQFSVYATLDGDMNTFLEQGTATLSPGGKWIVTFKKAIPVKVLYFKNFERVDTDNYWMNISEVSFYEEKK